jgi:AraC family transcriptional regulator
MIRADQDASRVIYEGTLFRIGQFRRGPKHPNFGGPHTNGGSLMVFPRTSVLIQHAGKPQIVADPNTVVFYNHGQEYIRSQLSDKGDLCDWFGFSYETIADAIRPFDPYVDDRLTQPFSFMHGPSDSTSYLTQRLVVDHILSNTKMDRLFIEEAVLTALKRVIENKYRANGMLPQKNKNKHEQDVVNTIQKMLGTSFEQELSLEQIAKAVNFSPFHLCRIFRKHTGQSIHQYLKQIRLRTSLEYATQVNADLTSLAVQIGFSSHSHFTESFRKSFGAPPSMLRNTSRQYIHQLLSKNSIA